MSFFTTLCSRYGQMMRGKSENLFLRETKPIAGFVIHSSMSRQSFGGGSPLPFKKGSVPYMGR